MKKNYAKISNYVKITDSFKQIRYKIRYLTVCLPKKPTITASSVILASFMSFLLTNNSFIDTRFEHFDKNFANFERSYSES